VPTQVVDHITPHNGDPVLFNDPDNWQPLCSECHDTHKRIIEQRFSAHQVKGEWEKFLRTSVEALMNEA
jgi:5-methylcytosine-specific restriction protein A